ncbi:hypothetical protein niasHS_012727 [Heterodera schachtii]|uniref:Myb-like domain-containing protein n=1 Tax=Heterodera schachtii TaxID=97005 RepID=A0ABD2ISB2_HETSC
MPKKGEQSPIAARFVPSTGGGLCGTRWTDEEEGFLKKTTGGQFGQDKARLAKLAAVFVAEGKKKGWSPRSLDSIKKKAQRLIRQVVIRNEEGPSCSATSAGGPSPAGRRMEDVVVPQDGGPLHQVQQHVYIDSLLNPQGQMAKATGGTLEPLVGIEEALEEAEALIMLHGGGNQS